MAALDAAPTGSLDILEVSRPPAEAGDTACRQLDQEWQRTRERVAVSTLTRACLLHTLIFTILGGAITQIFLDGKSPISKTP
jgi:hypothetical protein